jgi:hypothetical protein
MPFFSLGCGHPFVTRLLSDFVEIWRSVTDPNTVLLFVCECFGNACNFCRVASYIVVA